MFASKTNEESSIRVHALIRIMPVLWHPRSRLAVTVTLPDRRGHRSFLPFQIDSFLLCFCLESFTITDWTAFSFSSSFIGCPASFGCFVKNSSSSGGCWADYCTYICWFCCWISCARFGCTLSRKIQIPVGHLQLELLCFFRCCACGAVKKVWQPEALLKIDRLFWRLMVVVVRRWRI